LNATGSPEKATALPRIATSDDVAALVRVINRAYRVEDFFVDGDRTTGEEIGRRLGGQAGCFLVVDDDPCRPTGMLAGAVYVEVRGDRGYFGMLAVDPERQKQGLGAALVAAAEELCRAAGCQHLDIDVVNLRQELPPFYAALGFRPLATAPFPTPSKLRQEAYLVQMTKPL
jgi:GNAT superfamily N-acetyltransferase